MSTLDELIIIGEKIISGFEEQLDKESELTPWRKDCIVSCEILLFFLKSTPIDRVKILLLANVFRERYALNKPPAMAYWCRKIYEELSSSE